MLMDTQMDALLSCKLTYEPKGSDELNIGPFGTKIFSVVVA